ncbi:50S ribosomal protein L29 [Oceanithermus sp.]|uniref:50S ribosomal protein L29 n=1 Tax=Oceanithermus sp. TaxID=2268145 RepID=UPI0025EBB02D|nr:50S ribosomal protein L29 [Oceanithermus sp.]
MKLNEMRNLSPEELREQVREKKRELMDLRFQASIGQLAQNHRIRETKRTIARLLTVLREKQAAQ